MSRYNTIRTRGGPVVQSGLDVRDQRSARDGKMVPRLGIYRGLVVQTYPPLVDEGGEFKDNEKNRRPAQVECDVILVRTHQTLLHVPVMQRAFGINEAHAPWIPKAATRTITGQNELRFQVQNDDGSFEGVATPFDDMDGDMVAIQFVEGNPDYPLITGALTHERTNRVLRDGDGWTEGNGAEERGSPYANEYYVHHQGAEIRVNANGDVLIDTVGAYQERSTEDNAVATGDIRLRVKEGQKFTIAMGEDEDVLEVFKDGAQLRVDLGESADERVVLGDSFMQFFNDHIHPTGVGPSDVPTVPMDATLLSDLSKTKK